MRGDHVDAAALSLIVYSGQVKLNDEIQGLWLLSANSR